MAIFAVLPVASTAQTQGPTFQIQTVSPAVIGAGANGANLTLNGTLPDFSLGTYQVCFFTGSSSSPITPALVNRAVTLAVPAPAIQTLPAASFTAASNYQINAQIYVVPQGSPCDGKPDASLTNSYSEIIAEPQFQTYTGPTSIPQTNGPAGGPQAPPAALIFPGYGFSPQTYVTFGSFGNLIPQILSPYAISIRVPAAFSAGAAGSTAALSVCSAGGGNTYCAGVPPITLTVAALAPSAGTVTATPTPVLTTGTTVLTAQFKRDPQAPASSTEPGAPSGQVTFSNNSVALGTAPLKLDSTAVLVPRTTTTQVPAAAAPAILPPAGTSTTPLTVSMSDSTPGAAIFYTTDGTTPTSKSSAQYTAPFVISASQTISAVASRLGLLDSPVTSNAYVINLPQPAKLGFLVQPSDTATGAPIAPPVKVAIQDVNGNTVANSTLPVTLALGANPGTLAGTTTVNAVNGVATFSDLNVATIANGYILQASSGNLQPATSNKFNITPYPITISVISNLIGIGSTLSGNFTLGQAAPQGGVVVSLASSNTANVTISPASVTVPAGQTSGGFTYTGVASGSANLTASAPNYLTGTVQVTGTSAQVSLGTVPPVGPSQVVSLALSLATAAPPGGTTVSFTSSNPKVATVSSSVFVPAGQRVASTNPQITGITIGTTTINATAPGFAPDSRAVNVTVVATFNPATTNLNLTTSTNTTLNISAPAQPGGLTFTLSSDNPKVATVPASLTVAAGSTSAQVPITGVASGTTTIRANSPGVAEATGTVQISATILPNAATTGVNLLQTSYIVLPVAPPTPTTVTASIADPTIATISTVSSAVGTGSLSFNNVTSTYVSAITIQGQKQGTTTLTVSAPGYTTGTATITVDPSGFAFYYTGNFTTTTFSAPNNVYLYTVVIDPTTGNVAAGSLGLNPNITSVSVPLTSSNTQVGTIPSGAVVFNAGQSQAFTTFQPKSAGTTTLTIGTPPSPFTVPGNSQQIVATVTTPAIANSTVLTAVKLQQSVSLYLPVAPPTPETVTVTSNGPGIAVISTDPTVAGGTTATFNNVASTYAGVLWVQGLKAGATTLTVSAPGYTSGTINVTVDPSGFTFAYYQSSFTTTSISTPTQFTVYTAALNPQTLGLDDFNLRLSPGVGPVNVPVTSSNTAVGTITTSPLVFNTGDQNKQSSFQPAGGGTATLTLTNPRGYTTGATYQTLTATVTAPTVNIQDVLTGVSLENSTQVYLSTAPTSPITVTVTSSVPSVATLSASATTVGTSSVTFTNVTSTNVGTVYVQGQTQGTARLTASSSGYTSSTSTATVDYSGFGLYYYQGNFNTTTFSSPTALTYYTEVLDPINLNVVDLGQQISPGIAPVTLTVTSGTPSVGTVSPANLVFNPGDRNQQTNFTPVAAGSSKITINTPAGFKTPSSTQSLVATVTAPAISVNDTETGLNLENTLQIYLPVAPPNPVTVTVTTNGPLIAALSKDGKIAGGTTLTFPNVTGTFVGTISVQGQSLGGTTITVSAPGYTNGNGNVKVDQAGFIFNYYQGNISTKTTSQPTLVTVYPVSLTPGTLTVINGPLQINPSVGTVSVPFAFSNPGVGVLSPNPLVFTGGDGALGTSFQPKAAGSTTITVGTPTGYSTPSQYTQITATVQ